MAGNGVTATVAGTGEEHSSRLLDPSAPRLDGSSTPRLTACRGIRGATTVSANTAEDILEATDELLRLLIALNDLESEAVASVVFTTTPDLTATFPALAARQIGWTEVPLMCSHEMAVPGSLQKVVRILLHVNTTRTASEICHVYLKDARQLRPEWAYDDARVAALLGETARPQDGKTASG